LLVLGATAPHYIIEVAGYENPFETLHGLAITLYVIPLLYAALNFGWEGAILTALWGAALTSPSMWIWHRNEFHWFTELGQLAITLPVGILVAWRVTLEARLRQRAEKTSASLSLLNEVGDVLSHTMEVEEQLPQVVRRLLARLGLESAWLFLEPRSDGTDPLIVAEAASPGVYLPPTLPASLNRQLDFDHRVILQDGRTVAVLLSSETGRLGSLGATAAQGDLIIEEQIDLLMTVANQIRVALENATLYRQRQEGLQLYVRQVTQAQEDERLRIARDLHDDTAQELINIIRRIDTLSESDTESVSEELLNIAELTRKALRSVRVFARNLRPSALDDLGLVAAIESVVSESNIRPDQHFSLEVQGTERRCDPALELALFRITQEALRNAEKHSGAANVSVTLDFGEDIVTAEIADDGVGFKPPARPHDNVSSGRLGLLGMRERAELVGATFEIISSPGRGTTVRVAARREP
jgi:signal transduction histidine kinase